MDLRSKFTVKMRGDNPDGKQVSLKFSNKNNPIDITNIDELKPVTFKENHDLYLDFKVTDDASTQWKLFILGVDDYASQFHLKVNPDYKTDKANILKGESCYYYFPVGKYMLFDSRAEYKSNKNENTPLTPNIYTVEVTNGIDWCYAHFIISAKELSLKEWSDMIEEIDQESPNLTTQYINLPQGFTHKRKHGITKPFVKELTRLAPKLRQSLHFILQDLRFETAKKYRWVRIGKEKEIDAETIRKLNETPVDSGTIYAPFRYTNYNINDNRWIRYIAVQLIKMIGLSNNFYNSMIQNIKNQNNAYSNLNNQEVQIANIKSNQRKLIRLRNYISYVLTTTVLNSVSPKPPKFMSKGLIYSPKYNQFYRLYHHLKQIYVTKLFIAPTQYRYKKTDKLYEFWIFIKIIKILIKRGYKPIKGWGCDSTKALLNPNSRLLMTKPHSNIQLRIVYDDYISNYANKYDEPIKMIGTTHHRPDLRIDIFHGVNIYWGSVILDAKYKSLRNVLNGAINKGQLSGYYSSALDKFNNNSRQVRAGYPCVSRVVAVYPGSNNINKVKEDRSQYANKLTDISHLGISTKILRPDNKNSISKFSNYLCHLLHKRIFMMEYHSPDYHNYVFHLKINDEDATAITTDGDYMLIKAGSRVDSNSKQRYTNNGLFKKLVSDNVINIDDRTFTQDYLFSSPTQAGNMIYRNSISGRQVWKTDDNKSINDIFGNHKARYNH